jgi:hypothetical protein
MAAAITGSAHGHPAIRATHGKTLELAREHDITERATCVIGVAAELDEEALAALHGRVAVTFECGAERVVVRGRLNPAFRPGDPLVVRRADAVTRDAVLIESDTVAAALPRSFVEAVAVEGARIAVRVEELADEGAPGVLVVYPMPGTAQAQIEVGGLYLAMRDKNSPPRDRLAEWVTAALRESRRVTLTADLDTDAEARAAIAAAHRAGHTVLPSPTLPLPDAVLAVAGIGAAGCTTIDARAQRPQDVEWDAIDGALVSGVKADRAHKWLRRAERAGASHGVIGLDLGTPREQFVSWRPGEQPEIPGARGRTATIAVTSGQPERTPETSSVSRPEPRTSR